MAVSNCRHSHRERKSHQAKSVVIPFALPSEFSVDPLTEVVQQGAKEQLRVVVEAEVSAFLAGRPFPRYNLIEVLESSIK